MNQNLPGAVISRRSDGWMEVDVFHYQFRKCINEGTDTRDIHAQAIAWAMDQCVGQWECYQRLDFAFEKDSDALLFRMMFG
jgi:hypothetical protein